MRDFSAPVDLPLVRLLWRWLLPGFMAWRHPGTRLEIVGDGRQRFRQLSGQRTIICPNHGDHDDPETIFEFARLVGEDFHYLTAHEIFHGHHGLNGWLRYLGCYGVVRGTPDRVAFKTTRDLLCAGKCKIVIFPEGEISHQVDRLLPLKRGSVVIGFSALEKLIRQKEVAPVWILPLAVRYKFERNELASLKRRLRKLEAELHLPVNAAAGMGARLRNLVFKLVAALEAAYDAGCGSDLALPLRLSRLRGAILQKVAGQLRVILPAQAEQLDLAHMLQSLVYDQRFHYDAGVSQKLKSTNIRRQNELRDLNRDLYRAINLLAVDESLFAQRLRQEDLSNLIGVLEEEVFSCRFDTEPRRILIAVGQAINLLDYYGEYRKEKKQLAARLDQDMAAQLLSMLQEIDRQYGSIYVDEPQVAPDLDWPNRRTVMSRIRRHNCEIDGRPKLKWDNQCIRRLNDKAMLEILQAEALAQQDPPAAVSNHVDGLN